MIIDTHTVGDSGENDSQWHIRQDGQSCGGRWWSWQPSSTCRPALQIKRWKICISSRFWSWQCTDCIYWLLVYNVFCIVVIGDFPRIHSKLLLLLATNLELLLLLLLTTNLEWKTSSTWKKATTLATPRERLRETIPASWMRKITRIGGWGGVANISTSYRFMQSLRSLLFSIFDFSFWYWMFLIQICLNKLFDQSSVHFPSYPKYMQWWKRTILTWLSGLCVLPTPWQRSEDGPQRNAHGVDDDGDVAGDEDDGVDVRGDHLPARWLRVDKLSANPPVEDASSEIFQTSAIMP